MGYTWTLILFLALVSPKLTLAGAFDTVDCTNVYSLSPQFTPDNAAAIPDTGKKCNRYYSEVLVSNNTDTVWFNNLRGRVDYYEITFPFEVIARNIGVGSVADTQAGIVPVADQSYAQAGIMIHVNPITTNSYTFLTAGHVGPSTNSIEAKYTNNDASENGALVSGTLSGTRADLRIVGDVNGDLLLYWQEPNLAYLTVSDSWNLWDGTGVVIGTQPTYGATAYIGIFTHTFGNYNLPFAGTADDLVLVGAPVIADGGSIRFTDMLRFGSGSVRF